VCLLEEALVPDLAPPPRRLTVHLPLGLTRSSSVFLVRQDAPSAGLLRLKTWHKAAPSDYLDRFYQLQRALTEAAETALVAPLAVSLDASGWPSVLTEFRRGVPVLEAVESGALPSRAAADILDPLREILHRMHARGLAHGSIVRGNVIVRPDRTAAFLLDFGLSALLRPRLNPAAMASDDDEALDSLIKGLSPM
jgi:aminoglycoside phosphotransferase (APT) family kinase protein